MATDNDGVEMTNVDLGGGASSGAKPAPVQDSNPYRAQEDDMTNVDLGPQVAPKSFNTHVQGAVASADKGVSAATDNKVANQMESMTAGCFAKMGLKPAEGFFCISPGVCGLRMLILIIAILQAVYGVSLLFVAIFSTLLSLFAKTVTLQVGDVILLIFVFITQIFLGLVYGVIGYYGIMATKSLEDIVSGSAEIVDKTKKFYKMNVLVFIVAGAGSIIMAVLRLFAGGIFNIIMYWIWVAIWLFVSAYVVYLIWSYQHWVITAAEEGPGGLTINKIMKADKLATASSQPPVAPAV